MAQFSKVPGLNSTVQCHEVTESFVQNWLAVHFTQRKNLRSFSLASQALGHHVILRVSGCDIVPVISDCEMMTNLFRSYIHLFKCVLTRRSCRLLSFVVKRSMAGCTKLKWRCLWMELGRHRLRRRTASFLLHGIDARIWSQLSVHNLMSHRKTMNVNILLSINLRLLSFLPNGANFLQVWKCSSVQYNCSLFMVYDNASLKSATSNNSQSYTCIFNLQVLYRKVLATSNPATRCLVWHLELSISL